MLYVVAYSTVFSVRSSISLIRACVAEETSISLKTQTMPHSQFGHNTCTRRYMYVQVHVNCTVLPSHPSFESFSYTQTKTT